MKHLLVVLLLLSLVGSAFAQPPATAWRRSVVNYGFNYELYDVKQTSDSGYIGVGYFRPQSQNRNVLVVRTNPAGQIIWNQNYGGASNDIGQSLLPTPDGGFLIAGYTGSYGAGGNDAWLLKVNATGDSLWSRTFGGTADDYFYDIKPTTDGGIAVAGWTSSFGLSSSAFWLVKLNSAGDTLWTRIYGAGNGESCRSIQQTADGGYILAGLTSSHYVLLKTDANGDSLWTRAYGSTTFGSQAKILPTDDGGYLLSGAKLYGGGIPADFWLLKLDANGDSLWSRTYDYSENYDYCASLEPTIDCGYILAGTSSPPEGYPAGMIVKVDADGNLQWQRVISVWGSSSPTRFYSARQTFDHGFIIGGYTSQDIAYYDGLLIKLMPDSLPEMILSPDSLPLGDVWTGQVVEDSFRIVNLSNSALEIDSISSNHALVPSLTTPFTIPAGEFYRVRIAATIPDTLDYSAVLTVYGGSIEPAVTVTAHGIWTELRAQPAFVNWEQTAIGDTLDAAITLRSTGNAPLRITGILFTANRFTLLQSPADTLLAYDSTQIVVRHIVENTGLLQDTLVIETDVGDPVRVPLTTGVSVVSENLNRIPASFCFDQNYPNPFNPSTTITFKLPSRQHVYLSICDVLGRIVSAQDLGTLNPGSHHITFNGANYSSGIYFARLDAGPWTASKKLMLLK